MNASIGIEMQRLMQFEALGGWPKESSELV